jgi:acetyl esterase/lipase
VAVLAGLPFLLWTNRHGRLAVEASLYLPDMIVQPPHPFRPVELISDAPARERVTIDYVSRNGPRSIEADLYIPAHGSDLPGVVFSMGAPPLDLDEPRLVRIAEDSARKGVVMLVPFSDRLDDLRIDPEEVDALVAEFQYLQGVGQVDPHRVGFFGASVGGSLALVAAGDPRIAEDVDHVVSFGGYFDAIAAFGGIATDQILYGGVDEGWRPQRHAKRVMAHVLIDRVADAEDRDLLTKVFLDREVVSESQLATLRPEGRAFYKFLANRDASAIDDLAAQLPPAAVAELRYLSPAESIDRVQAELFIIHDRADPYIPYTELQRMRDALAGRDAPRAHFDELRLFEHVEPKLNQRPDVIALDSTRLLFRMYQLLLRWD